MAVAALLVAVVAAQAVPQIAVTDFLTLEITGRLDGTGQTDGLLARVNGLTEEPGGATRFFIHDLAGSIYIVDKASKRLTTYLDFNGRDGRGGMFHRFTFAVGYANGLISLAFDPAYRTNGRFYTVHLEEPAVAASPLPEAAHAPGLSVAGYTPTAAVVTPGDIQREAVLIEWTDTNIRDTAFTGSAREILRIQLNARIHPMSALTFNPAARAGDPDWRVLYIGCGDGGSGESRLAIRTNPQRLDTLVGKILRIVPDPTEHQSSTDVSENGRYRIPRDNPFIGTPGARKEIWAYGFRNPHRLTWIVDDVPAPVLVADSVGLYSWETVNIVHKGANYGYSQREGNEALQPRENRTTALPDPDRIPVQISDTVTAGTITPTYPVIQYPHKPEGGDAIGSGFAYRGRAIPALRGKYIFTDISTGKVWYADIRDMLAADDGKPETLAPMHPLKVSWAQTTGAAPSLHDSMFSIAETAYHTRGGKAEHLPGTALISATGRADAQLAVDASGELYVLTKSDGTIRAVTDATLK
jgi:hypothetical protein